MQDLVCSLKLPVLPLKLLDSSTVFARESSAQTCIDFGSAYPLPQCLRCSANLARDRDDRQPLRVVLALVLKQHPNCYLSYLWGIPGCSCHDSILSRIEVSGNPGEVQCAILLDITLKYVAYWLLEAWAHKPFSAYGSECRQYGALPLLENCLTQPSFSCFSAGASD